MKTYKLDRNHTAKTSMGKEIHMSKEFRQLSACRDVGNVCEVKGTLKHEKKDKHWECNENNTLTCMAIYILSFVHTLVGACVNPETKVNSVNDT